MKKVRTVVIVGASDTPGRISGELFRRLSAMPGYDAIPVHPRVKEMDGRRVLSSLAEVGHHPDVVSLYVKSEISRDMGPELLRLQPGKVVFNPGAENPPLREALERKGIATEEACSQVLLSQNDL